VRRLPICACLVWLAVLVWLGVASSLAQQQPPVSPVLPGSAGAIPYYAAPGGVLSPSTAQTLSASSILTRKDAVTAVAVNTTLGAHNVVYVTVGASGVTLTLPAAATTTVGSYRLIIADTGVGLLTLAPTGADKLNGVSAPLTKTGQYRGFEALWLSAADGWYVRPLSTVEAAGGSGTPGGSSTQLQFNNAGAFGGVAPLTWDGTLLNLAWASGLQLRFGPPDNENSPFVMSYTANINPGEPTRTDDTFVWGSNRDASGGRINAGDSAFSYHLETHWTDPTFGPTMEHYISSTGINGANRRVFFLQTLKSNGAQTTPWMWGLTTGLGMTWYNENFGTFWAGIDQTGMTVCDTCTWNKGGVGSDILMQGGSSLIRKENATDISIAPVGGNIVLGSAGAHNVTVPSNAKLITNGIYGFTGALIMSLGGPVGGVNYYDFSSATAGNAPEIKVDGSDADIPLVLRPKGTGTASIQVSGNKNVYVSPGGTRLSTNVMLGPSNLYVEFNPAVTLHVYDRTATTGVTKAVIQAGEAQGITNLQEWRNNADTVLTKAGATGTWTFTPTPTLAAAGTSTMIGSAHTLTLSGANPTTYATVDAVNFGSPTLVGTNAGQTVTVGSTLTVSGPIKSTNVTATTLAALSVPTWNCGTATRCASLYVDVPTGASSNLSLRALGASYLQGIMVGGGGLDAYVNTDAIRYLAPGNATSFVVESGTVGLHGNMALAWNDGSNLVWATGYDTKMVRDAANVVAMKNGTAANAFRVYGTTTGNKYVSLTHDGTNPIIGSSSGALKVDSTAIPPAATGTRYLCITTTGQITSSASACSGT
jgi:hypothetical protein